MSKSIWDRLGRWCGLEPAPRVVPTKLFKHVGERTEATDRAAQEIAECALRERYGYKGPVRFEWVHHNQPDYWLVFAIGEEQP